MKKTKIEQKCKNAFNAFFENETAERESFLDYPREVSLMPDDSNKNFTQNIDALFGWTKKLLLFLPGTFFLYFTMLSSVFFYKHTGINFVILFWLAAGSFMVWLGFGELKKVKHLLIPLSIILLSFTLGIFFSLFPKELQPALFFEYSIYLFPLVLITPYFVKITVDGKSRQE